MKNNGFNISPAYQELMKKLCVISIFDCNEDNKDTIFNITEKTSKEEQNTIDELQSTLIPQQYVDVDFNQKRKAFDKFISTAICESILYSQEREVSEEKKQKEK